MKKYLAILLLLCSSCYVSGQDIMDMTKIPDNSQRNAEVKRFVSYGLLVSGVGLSLGGALTRQTEYRKNADGYWVAEPLYKQPDKFSAIVIGATFTVTGIITIASDKLRQEKNKKIKK